MGSQKKTTQAKAKAKTSAVSSKTSAAGPKAFAAKSKTPAAKSTASEARPKGSVAQSKTSAAGPKTSAAAPYKEPGLLKRLAAGPVICAEGYVFELERRGYLQAGAFVPTGLTEHPEVVEQLHMDFVRAGSDVTQALTYYVHREKLRLIGRENDLVPMNKAAFAIAKKVARK